MPRAGFTGTVKGTGAGVAVTNAATTLTSGWYVLDNTARRIIDPSVALVVKDGGVDISATSRVVEYLTGKIRFPSYVPSGAITLDYTYLPTYSIAESRDFTLSISAMMLDRTSYDSAGAKQYLSGLRDAKVKLGRVSAFDDIDTVTGGLQTVESRFAAGTVYVVELGLGGSDFWRGFMITSDLELGAPADGLVTESVSFEAAPRNVQSVDLSSNAAWSFSS